MSVKRLEIDHKGLPFLDDKGVYVFYEDYAALQEKVAQRDAQIAKLERDEMQLIAERDHAEDALADMYQAATGKRPEWSNWFSFADAVEEVESQNSELRAQIAALTAENLELKQAADFATADDMWIEQQDGMLDYRYKDWYVDVLKQAMETPATDAAANALRAEGIQMLLNKYAPHTIASSEASEFASQLREGK
ncbi:hypothetical protein [Mixta calida]|uniref:hypothetical protein n=1 Tax=Mixta calida TaxID=665913 RepID=UPI0028AA1F87|nr:hypothetical protein [Mixta calida]